MLSPNIIIPFDGNHADIPTGFVRETTLDGKYPKATANATNPNTTGGNATHQHSSPAHTHTLIHHTHSGITSTTGTYGDNTNDTTDAQIMTNPHYHAYTTSTTSGGTLSDAITYQSVSNDPPYYEVIFIKSVCYNFIPINSLVLHQATTRDKLTFHTSSAGRYLKGAGSGANAGGTGGSYTNIHTITHGHTNVGHTHSGTSGGISDNEKRNRSIASPPNVLWPHTHTITLNSSSQAVNNFTGSLTTPETVEPAYKTLNIFKNSSGNLVLPEKGDIAMFLGNLADIPIGWALCDGSDGTPDMRSKFLKINSTPTSSSTGGSNTHTHAAQSHGHTSSGNHTHTGSVSAHNAGDRMVGNGNAPADPTQNHTLASCSTVQASYNDGSTTANSSDNQPEYRTVAYIMFKYFVGGGLLFLL